MTLGAADRSCRSSAAASLADRRHRQHASREGCLADAGHCQTRAADSETRTLARRNDLPPVRNNPPVHRQRHRPVAVSYAGWTGDYKFEAVMIPLKTSGAGLPEGHAFSTKAFAWALYSNPSFFVRSISKRFAWG